MYRRRSFHRGSTVWRYRLSSLPDLLTKYPYIRRNTTWDFPVEKKKRDDSVNTLSNTRILQELIKNICLTPIGAIILDPKAVRTYGRRMGDLQDP